MKWIAVVLYCFINITPANSQQWETVSGSVMKFRMVNDSDILSGNLMYKKGKKFIVIEKQAEKDFAKLFIDDSSAFDIIYEKGPKNSFEYYYDSLTCSLFSAWLWDDVMDVYNRQVETRKHTIKWFWQSSVIGTPGCYRTMTITRTRKEKRWIWKVVGISGYCLIP